MSPTERSRAIRVEAVFHVVDEPRGRDVAQRMVDRAHEIANLPECECDLDVTVTWEPPAPSMQPASPAPPPAA